MKAKQRTRPVRETDIGDIRNAVELLGRARTLLRIAQAGNAANYVARALKSAQGALHHARGMLSRQNRSK